MRNPHNESLAPDSIDDFSPGSAGGRRRSASDRPTERRCLLTGRVASRDTLLRIALGPDAPEGAVVLPDVLARAPGRGAWLGVDRADLEKALANGKLRGALARGFKGRPLVIPADLAERTEAALVRALTDRLGMEWRAGHVLAGADRIAEAARAARVVWLGHAADAREDGSRRLDQALRVGRDAQGSGIAGTRLPLDRSALSVALGRDNVVHLALTDEQAAGRITALLTRLQHFLGRSWSHIDVPAPDAATPAATSAGDPRMDPPREMIDADTNGAATNELKDEGQ